MVFCWCLLLSVFGLTAELAAGGIGIFLPLCAFLAFCFWIQVSPLSGVMTAILCGGVLDLVCGRNWCFTPLANLAAILPALLPIRELKVRHPAELALPGMIFGLSTSLSSSCCRMFWGSEIFSGSTIFCQMVFCTLCGLLLFPAAVMMLDLAANRLGLPTLLQRPKKIGKFSRLRRVSAREMLPEEKR